MTDPNEPRTTIHHEDVHIERPRSSPAGWWVAALLAVALVAGGFYLFSQSSQSDLQAARDTGRAEAMVDNALSQAQNATEQAQRATSEAASSASAAGAATAERAAAAADRTAQAAAASTDNAASDASTTEPLK